MIGEEFLGRKPVTLSKVKNILKERKKEKEFTYEQEQTFKYASTFAKLSEKKEEKLFAELLKLETITEPFAVKIVDLVPAEMEIMKLIPEKKEDVNEEDLKKALELVRKYSSK